MNYGLPKCFRKKPRVLLKGLFSETSASLGHFFSRQKHFRKVLAAEGGYMPTEEVVQPSKFGDVNHKVWVFWDCCDEEGRVVWNLLGFPESDKVCS